jgi:hypothetical protein
MRCLSYRLIKIHKKFTSAYLLRDQASLSAYVDFSIYLSFIKKRSRAVRKYATFLLIISSSIILSTFLNCLSVMCHEEFVNSFVMSDGSRFQHFVQEINDVEEVLHQTLPAQGSATRKPYFYLTRDLTRWEGAATRRRG